MRLINADRLMMRTSTKDKAKPAHWKFKPFPDDWIGQLYICSKCGYVAERQSKFCPGCGAEMQQK